MAQTAQDSVLTIHSVLDTVNIVVERQKAQMERDGSSYVIDARQMLHIPKFLGSSDALRYLESLPGVQTTNETRTGLHIQGCADYHSAITLLQAPVWYPYHLLGLFSPFITSHFSSFRMEQAEHTATTPNRLGGWVDFQPHTLSPRRFGMDVNIGLTNSEATLAIPINRRNALWLSARASYINLLYGRWLRTDDMKTNYLFQDYNLTYSSQPTERDTLVLTAFYSRDRLRLTSEGLTLTIPWQNAVGSVQWTRRLTNGSWQTNLSYSHFNNHIDGFFPPAETSSDMLFSSLECKNRFTRRLSSTLTLESALNYIHYFNQPMGVRLTGISLFDSTHSPALRHADALGGGIDIRHAPATWFAYQAGIYLNGYKQQTHTEGFIDPRCTLHFYPAANHEIAVHYGRYHQNFHKAALTEGGLPTDFFFLADGTHPSEESHSFNLRYTFTFLRRRYLLQAEAYFKQLHRLTESTGGMFQLLNGTFADGQSVVEGDGRNYGISILFQRREGIVTGYISYTLGWAKRQFPGIEGKQGYIYNAANERRHDLNIVVNARFAKRWHVGAQFVLASGIPYTQPQDAYLMQDNMVFRYGTHNAAHMGLYHRLDLTCSCDIIRRNGHELGINLTLYNVYAHANQQFVAFRKTLTPIYGTSLITITPSISLYGTL